VPRGGPRVKLSIIIDISGFGVSGGGSREIVSRGSQDVTF